MMLAVESRVRRFSSRNVMRARASAREFSFGTTVTSYPKISLSSTPPGLSDVMTGVPDASASSATVGQASSSDGSTNASAAASNLAMA